MSRPAPRVGRFLIYGLLDPRDEVLRYVGKTHKRRELRLAEHLELAAAGGTAPAQAWIRDLAAEGLVPRIFVIARLPSSTDWRADERRFIADWACRAATDFPLVHPPQTPKSTPTTIRGVALLNVQCLP